jgi:MSHA biogenesis protein MshI
MFALGKRKKSNSLTGVVCGTEGIALARVRRDNNGQYVLESCEFTALPDPSDGDIGKLMKGHGLEKKVCATVLPVGDYKLLAIDAPEVPPTELRAAIRWRVHDLIDFHIDDAVIDVFDIPPVGPADEQKKLYVAVARSGDVRQHIDRLEQAGARLEIIDIPELAIRNIAARLPEDEQGMATLYFAEDLCLMTITHQSCLYITRTLDIGYRQLLDTASEAAALLDRLALEIQRSLDYYEHHFHQPPARHLGILPAAEPLPGLVDSLQNSLGVATRLIELNDILESRLAPDNKTAARCILAVGAALRRDSRDL